MNVYTALQNIVEFVEKEFCEVGSQDCDCCEHFDLGHCPVHQAKELLSEEGYVDEE